MMYGNSSFGFGFSPDRSRDVDHYNNHYSNNLKFGNGNACVGYYGFSSTACTSTAKKSTTGWYDGAGRYHED